VSLGVSLAATAVVVALTLALLARGYKLRQ